MACISSAHAQVLLRRADKHHGAVAQQPSQPKDNVHYVTRSCIAKQNIALRAPQQVMLRQSRNIHITAVRYKQTSTVSSRLHTHTRTGPPTHTATYNTATKSREPQGHAAQNFRCGLLQTLLAANTATSSLHQVLDVHTKRGCASATSLAA